MSEGHPAAGAGGAPVDEVRQVVDTAINPFVVLDLRGRVRWASRSVEELLGHRSEDMAGSPMLRFIAPASHADAIAMMTEALDQRDGPLPPPTWEGVGPVLELLRSDGTIISCALAAATPIRTGIDGFVLQLRRANAYAAVEEVLLAMGTGQPIDDVLARVAAVLVGELPDADVTLFRPDRDGQRLVAVADRTGLSDELDLPDAAGTVWETAAATPGEVHEVAVADLPLPLRDRAAGRGYRWLTLTAVEPLTQDEPPPPMVTVWSRASHPMHRLNHDRVVRCGRLFTVALRWEWGRRALEWAATHDLLTGLHNRAAFLTKLASEQGRGRRQQDHVAVLYLDLDDFKPVNDDHGHSLGDKVLVEVAGRLRRAVRPTDVVARLGGDEFAVLCPGIADLRNVEGLADRLVEEVREPMVVGGVQVQVGLSVGIALVAEGEDADAVLDRADAALRAAKVAGKGRWRVA